MIEMNRVEDRIAGQRDNQNEELQKLHEEKKLIAERSAQID